MLTRLLPKSLTLFAKGADHRLSPPVTGPLAGLTDVLVHAADIRIPLGIPHTADPEHVAWVLDFLTSRRQLGFFPRARLRGISLIDEVTGRTWGKVHLWWVRGNR